MYSVNFIMYLCSAVLDSNELASSSSSSSYYLVGSTLSTSSRSSRSSSDNAALSLFARASRSARCALFSARSFCSSSDNAALARFARASFSAWSFRSSSWSHFSLSSGSGYPRNLPVPRGTNTWTYFGLYFFSLVQEVGTHYSSRLFGTVQKERK